MLISKDYVNKNKDLHKSGIFGVSGYKWASTVAWLLKRYSIKHVLDYGAGQQTLKKSLGNIDGLRFECYDPAIPELAANPEPAELLTCTDVLEHIEPEHIEQVLDHVKGLAEKMVFLVIPTGPAAKVLSDGRNAHLIQQPVEWWLPKLIQRFDVISLNHQTDDIVFIGSAKKDNSNQIDEAINEYLSIIVNFKLQSLTFDGVCLNFSIKSKRLVERLLPRIVSIIKLGARMGIARRIRTPKNSPSVTITYY